jgi:hypothetical protein
VGRAVRLPSIAVSRAAPVLREHRRGNGGEKKYCGAQLDANPRLTRLRIYAFALAPAPDAGITARVVRRMIAVGAAAFHGEIYLH